MLILVYLAAWRRILKMTSRGRGGLMAGGRGGRRSIPTPEAEQNVLEEEIVLEEEAESSQGKKELDPNGIWFNDSAVSRTISDAFKQYFHEPWRNYSQVDPDTKDHWFDLFKSTYRWRPELDPQVRRGFDHKAGIRLKDLHHYVTKKKMGVCPPWMPNHVHEQMMKNVKDDAFKLKSQKALKNRRGGDLANPVLPSHCQGSISASERAKRLAAKNGGVLPTAAELYLDTHMREEPGKGKVPVNEKVKRIKETYEKNVVDCQERGIEKTPNQIFYYTIGGRKRGKVPGLGASEDFYFKRSSRRVDTSSSCTQSLVAQLSARLEESERAREESEQARAEMERERLEETRKNTQTLAEMKRTLDKYNQMFTQCNGFDFTQHRPCLDDHSASSPLQMITQQCPPSDDCSSSN